MKYSTNAYNVVKYTGRVRTGIGYSGQSLHSEPNVLKMKHEGGPNHEEVLVLREFQSKGITGTEVAC